MVTLRAMPASDESHEDDPRARAARTKRDRTRRALLDAADSAFGSRGWARTRMEDIAQSAGVSAATAYNHFPTKHALLGHVYQPLVRPLIVQAHNDIAAGRSMLDAIDDQVRALCRVTDRNHELTAALWSAVQEYTIRVGGAADPDDQDDPRTLVPIPEALLLLIAHGQETGELRPYPSALEMSTLVVNLLLLRSVNRPGETPQTTAELLLTVIFGSLRPDLMLITDSDERPFRRAQ